jgi:hypothetical protein
VNVQIMGWSLGTESNRRPPEPHSGVLAAELPQGLNRHTGAGGLI